MCFYNHLVRRKWCSKRSLKSKWLCVDIVELKLIMKEIVCTVCESKEPVICCATCEALYCENCKVSYHEKVKLSICNLELVLFVGFWVKHLGKIICQFEEYVVSLLCITCKDSAYHVNWMLSKHLRVPYRATHYLLYLILFVVGYF